MVSTMDAALKHAKSLAEYLNKCSSTYIIHIALKELGIGSDAEGFQYAKNTVRMLFENPGLTLANGVYAAVGLLGNPSAGEKPVENAVRRAIKHAWEERDEKVWECYFPTGKQGRSECPSNKVFLMAIVDFVVLWKGFCEEVNYGK